MKDSSRLILVVDDNPSDISLTRRAFEKACIGIQLVVAEDGETALDYLQGDCGRGGVSELPVLVLLDLKLPRLSGLEVLRQIRSDVRTRRLPVVILSTSSEEQDLASAYDLGANSYIRKYVDFKQFASAIDQLGRYWLLLNEAPPPVS